MGHVQAEVCTKPHISLRSGEDKAHILEGGNHKARSCRHPSCYSHLSQVPKHHGAVVWDVLNPHMTRQLNIAR